MKRVRALPHLPPRARDGHKGDYGRVLVLAGSRGMVGAAVLTGKSALRSGAGLVTVATPASVYPILASQVTCCTTRPLPETRAATLSDQALDEILVLSQEMDVVALGPGLGRHASTTRLVHQLVKKLPLPMVLDADALNALAENTGILKKSVGARILTPHPGEMARLLKLKNAAAVQKDRLGSALGFAEKHEVVVLLKGYESIVTDGNRIAVNPTGNPGMASGGTGDVLTGVIAGLLAQGLGPFSAAQLGAYLHGLAGDIAAAEVGKTSLIATDVLDALPRAFKKHQVKSRKGRTRR